LIYNKYIFNKSFIFKNCQALIQCSFHDDNEYLENDYNCIQFTENKENIENEECEDKMEKKTEIVEEENKIYFYNIY